MPFFQENSNTTVHDGRFIDESVNIHVRNEVPSIKNAGLGALRKALIPEAIHNSSARDPSRCLPGTREEHVHKITDWCSGDWDAHHTRVLWLQGPAGVGKSALAQTCAERLGDRLGATFFFFRPNRWNKPSGFLPTIIYQLAMKHPAYRNLVDAKVQHDPLVLTKSIEVQFRELLAEPLRELNAQHHVFGQGIVIIVDGLDECDGLDAQRAIVEVIISSVHQQTTPFLWAFFSRPEPHIKAALSSELASKVCWQLNLPVSRDADQDIEAYLCGGFRTIRERYNFPSSAAWPSKEDIQQLVDQSAGLFIYVASVIRYIDRSPGALGPQAKLQLVLESSETDKSKCSNGKPLSNLDKFYILIMKQIPKDILPNTLLLLLIQLRNFASNEPLVVLNCSILGFSLTAFYAVISNLHSVLKIESSEGLPQRLSFYHASFSDFLCDVERSTSEFCLNTTSNHSQLFSRCADALFRISNIHDANEPANAIAWSSPRTTNKGVYIMALTHMFYLSESPLVHLEVETLRQLSRMNWAFAAEWYEGLIVPMDWMDGFFKKIPRDYRRKIIRAFHHSPLEVARQIISATMRGRSGSEKGPRKRYIMGTGNNKVSITYSRQYFGFYDLYLLNKPS